MRAIIQLPGAPTAVFRDTPTVVVWARRKVARPSGATRLVERGTRCAPAPPAPDRTGK